MRPTKNQQRFPAKIPARRGCMTRSQTAALKKAKLRAKLLSNKKIKIGQMLIPADCILCMEETIKPGPKKTWKEGYFTIHY